MKCDSNASFSFYELVYAYDYLLAFDIEVYVYYYSLEFYELAYAYDYFLAFYIEVYAYYSSFSFYDMVFAIIGNLIYCS